MNKRAFVTGTTSGIGKEIARTLLGKGWHVTGLARRANDAFENDPRYAHIRLDLSDLHELERAVRDGRLDDALRADIAFLNAGAFGPAPAVGREIETADFLHVMTVNCIANKVLLDALVRSSRDRKIVISSSISALRFRAGMSAYSASKAALNALANIYAQENPHVFIANIGLCNVATPLMDVGLTPNPALPELLALRERARQPDYLTPPATRAAQLIEIIDDPARHDVRSGEFVEIRSIATLNKDI